MKILKLPDCADPLRKIRKAALKRDLICPFCGNKKEVVDDRIINGLSYFDWNR